MGQFAWVVKFALRMFTWLNVERTNFGSNKILFLPLTRIDFGALVSSRAVRISSRAVRVFPALSLRRIRPSYGTFSLMVLQGNCAQGRTGHMIKLVILPPFFAPKLITLFFNLLRQNMPSIYKPDSCADRSILALLSLLIKNLGQ